MQVVSIYLPSCSISHIRVQLLVYDSMSSAYATGIGWYASLYAYDMKWLESRNGATGSLLCKPYQFIYLAAVFRIYGCGFSCMTLCRAPMLQVMIDMHRCMRMICIYSNQAMERPDLSCASRIHLSNLLQYFAYTDAASRV